MSRASSRASGVLGILSSKEGVAGVWRENSNNKETFQGQGFGGELFSLGVLRGFSGVGTGRVIETHTHGWLSKRCIWDREAHFVGKNNNRRKFHHPLEGAATPRKRHSMQIDHGMLDSWLSGITGLVCCVDVMCYGIPDLDVQRLTGGGRNAAGTMS